MIPVLQRVLGPVLAAVLAAGTGAFLPSTAPHAAGAAAAPRTACPGASGVTAVVDFNELGGGVTAGCDRDGGGDVAARVFADAGYLLEPHPRMSTFVCKVSRKPASGPCAENDAFWSLWWSNGKDGRWHFSTQGANGLTVPDGGYVAFAWHQGTGEASEPDARPTPRARSQQEPEDDGGEDTGPEGGGTAGGSDGDATSTAPSPSASEGSATPSEAPSDRKREREKGKRERERDARSPEPSPSASSDVPEVSEITEGPDAGSSEDAPTEDDGALPSWVPIGLAVLAVGAAAAVPIIRRRSG